MAYKDHIKRAEYQKLYRITNSRRQADYRRKWKANNYEAVMWDGAKQRAKRKELEFDIDINDIVIPYVCPVLDIPLQRNEGRQQFNSPSLDRIDNSKGYVKGNIMVISNLANIMKSYASPYELVKFAQWVLRMYKEDEVKKTARNESTGDWLVSKPNNEMFEKNFDLIFRKKNPNQAELFEAPIDKEWDQMKPVGQEILPEYELHKSTGEVIKKETNG